MTRHRIEIILLIFELVLCFVNCQKKIKIGYLTSYANRLSGAVALAVDQINEYDHGQSISLERTNLV